jgi:hypothetical protein
MTRIKHRAAVDAVEIGDLDRRVGVVDRIVGIARTTVRTDVEIVELTRLPIASSARVFGRLHPVRRYGEKDRPESFERVLQSWDTANKATELSDFSVCTTWGVRGKNLYLLGLLRQRLEYPALKRAVREQQSLYHATVLIEDKASGTQLIQESNRRVASRGPAQSTYFWWHPFMRVLRARPQPPAATSGRHGLSSTKPRRDDSSQAGL